MVFYFNINEIDKIVLNVLIWYAILFLQEIIKNIYK